jgi:hypothetical protein
MSKRLSTENSFRDKFKNRMENLGKDGVLGIVKNTENPINSQIYNNGNADKLSYNSKHYINNSAKQKE